MRTANQATFSILAIIVLLTQNCFASIQQDEIDFPNQVKVNQKTLFLNGTGIRKATIFKIKVYLAGLYLETPTHDAKQIIDSTQLKRVELKFVHDVPADKMINAWNETFYQNCDKHCESLKPALSKLTSMMTNLSKGDKMTFTFLADAVQLEVKGSPVKTIDGRDFGQVLLKAWLGNNPPNQELKEGMLGLGLN